MKCEYAELKAWVMVHISSSLLLFTLAVNTYTYNHMDHTAKTITEAFLPYVSVTSL